jgi:hypothetical protein
MSERIEVNESHIELNRSSRWSFSLWWSTSIWVKYECKSATKSAARPDSYSQIQINKNRILLLTFTTTNGTFDSNAWQTVRIDNAPPSTNTITIGVRISVVTNARLIYRKRCSISVRRNRTSSAVNDSLSNNKKWEWLGSKSHRPLTDFFT